MTPARAAMLARRREVVRSITRGAFASLFGVAVMFACSITSIRF